MFLFSVFLIVVARVLQRLSKGVFHYFFGAVNIRSLATMCYSYLLS